MAHDYDPLEAAAVTYRALPTVMQAALSEAAVLELLELEFRFYSSQLERAATPERYSAEACAAYLLTTPARSGRLYSAEQIAHVLAAEEVYLRRIGLLDG